MPKIKVDPEWPMVELGVICNLIGGGTPSKSESGYWVNGTIKWISSKYINGEGSISGYDLITEQAVKESSTQLVQKYSTIAVTRVSVGKIAYADDNYAINQDLTGLVIKEQAHVNNRYLFISVKSLGATIDSLAQGLGVRGITRDTLSKLKIPLPPISIQQDIITQIENEQALVNGSKSLITIYEQKIRDKIAELWNSE